MTGESEPRRRDEASSTHARTIAKALSGPDGTAGFCGGCQKTVIKTYRSRASRSRQTVPLQRIQGIRDSRIRLDDFSTFGVEPVYTNSPQLAERLPKKSLTLAKKPAASGWVAPEESFSNSASNSCCFLVRFCGVSTTTWTYMSPVWRERSTGMPFDAMRNRRLDWVPAGTFTFALALSMVGTSNSPPRAAVTIEIGTRQCRSAPSRWKNWCWASDRKM